MTGLTLLSLIHSVILGFQIIVNIWKCILDDRIFHVFTAFEMPRFSPKILRVVIFLIWWKFKLSSRCLVSSKIILIFTENSSLFVLLFSWSFIFNLTHFYLLSFHSDGSEWPWGWNNFAEEHHQSSKIWKKN